MTAMTATTTVARKAMMSRMAPGQGTGWTRSAANVGFGLAGWAIVALVAGGCNSEPRAKREFPVLEVAEPAPPEPTPQERLRAIEEARENQPEPTLNPEDARETFALLMEKGRSTLRGIYTERFNILTQMREIKFDAKADEDKKKVMRLANQIEDYALGDKRDELETAAERFCKLIEDLRAAAEPLEAEGAERLTVIDAELKALEDKQAGGGKVATSQYEKLEAQRKIASAPMLGARYVWLAMKTLFQEAYVLADLGPRRAQLQLRDCLGRDGFKPIPYELSDKERLGVVKRAKWYRSGHE